MLLTSDKLVLLLNPVKASSKIIHWFFFALIGAAIAQKKGRVLEGFIAGLLLGPIGIIWIIFQKPKRKCPECGGIIEKNVKKCKHCGSEIKGIK